MSSEAELYSVATTEQGLQGDSMQAAEVGFRTRKSIYMPSSEFKGYDDVLPGAAERLLALFEEQARHRMAMEERMVQNDLESSKMSIEADQANRTQATGLGLLALLIFVGLAVFFAFMGMEAAAIASVIVPGVQCIGDWIGKLIADRRTTGGGD